MMHISKVRISNKFASFGQLNCSSIKKEKDKVNEIDHYFLNKSLYKVEEVLSFGLGNKFSC
jgi:hypothetical protein